MYTLKNDDANTDHLGRTFSKIRFRLTRLPRNTRRCRWLIRLAMSLIVVQPLVAFDNFIVSPTCQTVSYDQHSAGLELLLKPGLYIYIQLNSNSK